MSLSIASIPGAEKCLTEIDQLAHDRILSFGRYFVPVDPTAWASKRLVPGAPHYLCNVVFQGGGVLGLAHVGFLTGLERAGVRCAGVAGTSAGAIVATALACARGPRLYESVSDTLLRVVSTMPLASFVDGPRSIRRVIKHALSGHPVSAPSHWWGLVAAITRTLRRRGLNPGEAFERWLIDTFASLHITDNRALIVALDKIRRTLQTQHHVIFRTSVKQVRDQFLPDSGQKPELLRVVATALPVGLKLVFPDNLRLLDDRYMSDSPAVFVRASMAIPGFFEPRLLEPRRKPWEAEVEKRLKGFLAPNRIREIAVLPELQMVDGGLLSNVQVDAFDQMLRPQNSQGSAEFPTVIVTLSQWSETRRRSRATIGGLLNDVLGLADAVRLQRDRDAWFRITSNAKPNSRVIDLGRKIVQVDTSDFNWLNFSMGDEESGRLFMQGLKAAKQFLQML